MTTALVIPGNLALAGPLGGVGTVTPLLGLVSFGLVTLVFIRRDIAQLVWGDRPAGWAVMPVALLLYVVVIFGLYGASYRRLMAEAEVSGGTRAILATLAFAGIGLMTATFVARRRDLRIVMGALVLGATISAFIGILQRQFDLNLAELLRVPGTVVTRDVALDERNNFIRVIGSAAHPIEFTVVLASVLPLVFYLATYATTRGKRQSAAFSAVLILVVLPLGVTRSGIVGLVVAILCYSVVWTWRQRLTAIALALAGGVFYRVVQPGALGTILGSFVNAGTDNSIEGRTNDYAAVDQLMAGREVLGIGPGTFQPDQYFILDNQYLVSYVTGGFVGMLAFIALPVTGLIVAYGARRRATFGPTKDAAQAVFASIACLAVCAVTFDMLSFLQVSFVLFVVLGLAAAVRHIAANDDGSPVRATSPTGSLSHPPVSELRRESSDQ